MIQAGHQNVALKQPQAETAAEGAPLCSAILDKAFKGEV